MGALLTPRLRKSAINHRQLLWPGIHRHCRHADIHTCTRGCMYTRLAHTAMNICYSTYISFSKLGFEALHVQSGPCSHSLNHSVKAVEEKKTQMFKLSDVCFHFKCDLVFLKRLKHLTHRVCCGTVSTQVTVNMRSKSAVQQQRFTALINQYLPYKD